MMAMEKGIPIRSVCRALDIIKTVNRMRSATLTEIANETELPYPTVFRIAQTLIHEGVIEQEPFRKRYRATKLVKLLSAGFQDDDRMIEVADPAMRAFTSENLWPVTLAVRVGNRMMVTHSTHPMTTQTFHNYHPGYTLPLLDCASGRAYLAFCDDVERETVFNGLKGRQSAHKTMSLQILLDGNLLEQIRQDGYATMVRTQFNETPGKTSAFAVPIYDDGQIKAALSMTYFANAMTMEQAIAKHLKPLQALARMVGDNIANADAVAAQSA